MRKCKAKTPQGEIIEGYYTPKGMWVDGNTIPILSDTVVECAGFYNGNWVYVGDRLKQGSNFWTVAFIGGAFVVENGEGGILPIHHAEYMDKLGNIYHL